jgi:hypothetical protein
MIHAESIFRYSSKLFSQTEFPYSLEFEAD